VCRSSSRAQIALLGLYPLLFDFADNSEDGGRFPLNNGTTPMDTRDRAAARDAFIRMGGVDILIRILFFDSFRSSSLAGSQNDADYNCNSGGNGSGVGGHCEEGGDVDECESTRAKDAFFVDDMISRRTCGLQVSRASFSWVDQVTEFVKKSDDNDEEEEEEDERTRENENANANDDDKHNVTMQLQTDCVSLLRELCYTDGPVLKALSDRDEVVLKLFELIGDNDDAREVASVVVEELLAVRDTMFPLERLGAVRFANMVDRFDTRRLTQFCRVLSLLVYEPNYERDVKDRMRDTKYMELLELRRSVARGDTAQQRVAAANQRVVLETPGLLAKLVVLLDIERPGDGYVALPSMNDVGRWLPALLESAVPGIDVGDSDRWMQLIRGSPAVHQLVMPLLESARDVIGERPAGAADAAAAKTARDAIDAGNARDADFGYLLPDEDQFDSTFDLVDLVEAARSDQERDSVRKLALATHLGELLFLLCTLMGGKHRVAAQDRLASLGIGAHLSALFDRVEWREKAHSHPSFERLHGENCECTPHSALKIQFFRCVLHFCDRHQGCSSMNKLTLLSADEISATVCQTRALRMPLPAGVPWSNNAPSPSSSSSSSPAGAAASSSSSASSLPIDMGNRIYCPGKQGLMSKLIELLRSQSAAAATAAANGEEEDEEQSSQKYWISSCVESFARGDSALAQTFLTQAGLIRYLVNELLDADGSRSSSSLSPSSSSVLQIHFDLLAEVTKFSRSSFATLNSILTDSQFECLFALATSNLVDSNVFLRAISVSLRAFRNDTDVTPVRRCTIETCACKRQENVDDQGTGAAAGASSTGDAKRPLPMPYNFRTCRMTPLFESDRARIRLVKKLFLSVSIDTVMQETLCCLNTALALLVFAEQNGQLGVYLSAIVASKKPTLLGNTVALLRFWSDYYASSHPAERDSFALERSTRIPFDQWQATYRRTLAFLKEQQQQ
jgi:Protein of unknown function (DUF3689)